MERCSMKQMPTILCVEKLGAIKELNVKNVNEDELYKKAGLKTETDFKLHTTWKIKVNRKSYQICVYGKTKGRANSENKYEFPPPIDNTLFFGNCLIVNKDEDDTIISVTLSEWEKIYEELFGGFEDLGDEDSDDSEEEDEDEKLPKTKSGYAKDGFVVDDDEDMDESEDEDFTESEEEKPKKRKYTARKKTTKKENTIKIDVPTSVFDVGSDIDLDFVDELQEEEYV